MFSLRNATYEEAYAEALVAYNNARATGNTRPYRNDYKGNYYLGGPMTGIPQFNFPAFDEAATDLRRKGYLILSPAEMDDATAREHALASKTGLDVADTGHSWEDYLKRDLFIVLEADGVICLPGWEKSKGARLETFVAKQLGKPIYGVYPELDEITEIPYKLEEEWTEYWIKHNAIRAKDHTNDGVYSSYPFIRDAHHDEIR